MSEDLAERMARAVYAGNQWNRWVEETQSWYHIPWEELAASERSQRVEDQRNALLAMREPTEAMEIIGNTVIAGQIIEPGGEADAGPIFRAMIDAACAVDRGGR